MTTQRRSRLFTGLSAIIAAGLLLAGCSAQADTEKKAEKQSSESSQALPAAEGKTKYPLTLKSPYGETVLKQRPERIAAIVPTAIDTELLFALDVKPVLSSQFVHEGGYLEDHGAKDVKTYEYARGEALPIEAIAASKPDRFPTLFPLNCCGSSCFSTRCSLHAFLLWLFLSSAFLSRSLPSAPFSAVFTGVEFLKRKKDSY